MILLVVGCKPAIQSMYILPCTIKSAEAIADAYVKKKDKEFYNIKKKSHRMIIFL